MYCTGSPEDLVIYFKELCACNLEIIFGLTKLGCIFFVSYFYYSGNEDYSSPSERPVAKAVL